MIGPSRRLGALVVFAACGARGTLPANRAPRDATVAEPVALYDPSWGTCSAEAEAPFGNEATVEFVLCTFDPGRPDGEAHPVDYTARLAVRRSGSIGETVEVGTFTKWEEGTTYRFVGVLESPGGAFAAFTMHVGGSMGMERGSMTLTGHADDGASFAHVFEISATTIDVAIAPDRRLATVALCNGACDYQSTDPSTRETLELRFDGKTVTRATR